MTNYLSLKMELSFFDFEDQNNVEHESYDWNSDDEECADDANTILENKAFWELQEQLLQEALSKRSSTERKILKVTEEVFEKVRNCHEICKCLKECRKNCVLRKISDGIRDMDYNSALCISKWRSSPETPSGEHAYIDVMTEVKNSKRAPVRIIIELNFRPMFEMARASPEYNKLVSNLPEIYVGKSERLRNVIKIMCGAAKECMKENKMHMAPWRKHKYMTLKWFGSCERVVPSMSALSVSLNERSLKPKTSLLTFDLHCPAVEVL